MIVSDVKIDTFRHFAVATNPAAPSVSVVMKSKKTPLKNGLSQTTVKPTTPIINPSNIGGEIEYWGNENDFPQKIVDLYSRVPIIPQTINKIVTKIIMGGLVPMQVQGYKDDGSEVLKWVPDPEINTFVQNFRNKAQHLEIVQDYVWFNNAFCEFILSKNKQRIVQVAHQEASYCRYEEQSKQSGLCENVFINANWPMFGGKNDPYTYIVPTINPYDFNEIERIKSGNHFKYIYPVYFPSPGKSFYQLAPHDSIRTSGWLDVQMDIPIFKKYLLKNSMSVTYQFTVDEDYWPKAYGEKWEKGTPDQRRAIKLEWLNTTTTNLTDPKNAGKGLILDKFYDRNASDYRTYVDFEIIEIGKNDGKFLEDMLESSAEIFYAFGIDPTVAGFAGGGKMGARSGGSDKREAWLIDLAQIKPHREAVSSYLHFVAEFNGWSNKYPNLVFRTQDTILTTLDTGAGTQKTIG